MHAIRHDKHSLFPPLLFRFGGATRERTSRFTRLGLHHEVDIIVPSHNRLKDLDRCCCSCAVHRSGALHLAVLLGVFAEILKHFLQILRPLIHHLFRLLLPDAHAHHRGGLSREHVPPALLEHARHLVDVELGVLGHNGDHRSIGVDKKVDVGVLAHHSLEPFHSVREAPGHLHIPFLAVVHQGRPCNCHGRPATRALDGRGSVQPFAPIGGGDVCPLAHCLVPEGHHRCPLCSEAVLVHVDRHRGHSADLEVPLGCVVPRSREEGEQETSETVVNVQPQTLFLSEGTQLLDGIHHTVREGRGRCEDGDGVAGDGLPHLVRPQFLVFIDGDLHQFDAQVVARLEDGRVARQTGYHFGYRNPPLTGLLAVRQSGKHDGLCSA
eukprot:Sspe_Gene.76353::Locus_47705_Transcript_1_1_Confidence_1.000_Length_2123::g.76353::m.76353